MDEFTVNELDMASDACLMAADASQSDKDISEALISLSEKIDRAKEALINRASEKERVLTQQQ